MAARVPYPKALAAYPRIRQSLLGEFDQCALAAWFSERYTRNFSTFPQARGQLFHRFAARALREMQAQGEPTIEVDVALAILTEVIRQDDVDRVCPICGSRRIKKGVSREGKRTCLGCKEQFQSEFVNLAMASVKDLYWEVKKWAYDNTWSIDDLVDVEHRLFAKITYPNPHGGEVERVLTGQLDTLFVEGIDHGIVLDWKDSWALPPPTEISFIGYFQQRCYGLLVLAEYRSIEQVTLREFYPRFSEAREATIWRHNIDEITAEMSALVERFDRAVEENIWRPTPGKWCGYCTRPELCPIPDPARNEGMITNVDQAEQVAHQLIVANAVAKKAKAALAAWSADHGPIPLKDAKGYRQWGHRQVTRIDRPTKEALEQAIREAGSLDHLNLDSLYREIVATRFEPHVPEKRPQTESDADFLASLQETANEAKAARVPSNE